LSCRSLRGPTDSNKYHRKFSNRSDQQPSSIQISWSNRQVPLSQQRPSPTLSIPQKHMFQLQCKVFLQCMCHFAICIDVLLITMNSIPYIIISKKHNVLDQSFGNNLCKISMLTNYCAPIAIKFFITFKL
jgi:hypothetical protein